MKIDVPPEMYGDNPAGFINHLHLVVQRRPIGSDTVCVYLSNSAAVSTPQTRLVSSDSVERPQPVSQMAKSPLGHTFSQ